MRMLVIYATKLGSTREIAERIAGRLTTAGMTVTTLPADAPGLAGDIAQADGCVIGSAVYAGHWLRPAIEVIRQHRTELATRPTWLFSSGPVGTSALEHEPVTAKEVAEAWSSIRATDHRTFPGALDRDDLATSGLGRVERFVAERLIPEGDFREWPAIDAWADGIAARMGTLVVAR